MNTKFDLVTANKQSEYGYIYICVYIAPHTPQRATTKIQIPKKCWDKKSNSFSKNTKEIDVLKIKEDLLNIEKTINDIYAQLKKEKAKITPQKIIEIFRHRGNKNIQDPKNFISYCLEKLSSDKNIRYSSKKVIRQYIKLFSNFLVEKKKCNVSNENLAIIDLIEIHNTDIIAFKSWLISKKYKNSYIASTLSAVKTAISSAIEEICEDSSYKNPFENIKIGIPETIKEEIEKDVLDTLIPTAINLREHYRNKDEKTFDAISFFLLMVCLRGCRPIDALLLKKEDIRDDDVCFVEYKKTKIKIIKVKITPLLSDIINSYPKNVVFVMPYMEQQKIIGLDTLRKKLHFSYQQLSEEEMKNLYHVLNIYKLRISKAIKAKLLSIFGIEKNPLKIARQTVATIIDREFGLQGAAEVLGHASTSMTQMYAGEGGKHKRANEAMKIIIPQYASEDSQNSSGIEQSKISLPEQKDNLRLIFRNTQNIIKLISKKNAQYDLSLVNYEDDNKPIMLVCPSHGAFEVFPIDAVLGKFEAFCPKCKPDNSSQNSFVKRALAKYGDKFDYTHVVIIKTFKEKIIVICNACKCVFERIAQHHLKQQKCPSCGK